MGCPVAYAATWVAAEAISAARSDKKNYLLGISFIKMENYSQLGLLRQKESLIMAQSEIGPLAKT